MKHEKKHSILVQHSHFFKNKDMCENQKNSWNSSKKRNLVASTSSETEKTKKQSNFLELLKETENQINKMLLSWGFTQPLNSK